MEMQINGKIKILCWVKRRSQFWKIVSSIRKWQVKEKIMDILWWARLNQTRQDQRKGILKDIRLIKRKRRLLCLNSGDFNNKCRTKILAFSKPLQKRNHITILCHRTVFEWSITSQRMTKETKAKQVASEVNIHHWEARIARKSISIINKREIQNMKG